MTRNKCLQWTSTVLILIIVSLACNLPQTGSPPTPTIQADIQENGQTASPTPLPEDIQTPTDSPPSTHTPTTSPSATVTLTPTITLTSTPEVPMAGVSVNTNCRAGPGKDYQRLGTLLVGEKTEIVGIGSTGYYYIVRNPDQPGDLCWLWDKYVEISGGTGQLPKMTPPPSPTPLPQVSYQITVDNFHDCGPDVYLTYWVGNDGQPDLESAQVKVEDLDTDTVLFGPGHTDFPFVPSASGCPPGIDSLGRGAVAFIAVNIGSDPTPGHTLRGTIKICSQDGLGEPCLTKEVDWTVSSPSARSLKSNPQPVDPQEVLDQVAGLPISTWKYRYEGPGTQHIGPMAEDFYAAFGLGEDQTHIHAVDADGVALASIQALDENMRTLEKRIAALESNGSVPWWTLLLALALGSGLGSAGYHWWGSWRRQQKTNQ